MVRGQAELVRDLFFARASRLDKTLSSGHLAIQHGQLLVELKAVERLLPVHEAQVITYLKLSGLLAGLLVNFDVAAIRHGLRRLPSKRDLPVSSTPC